MTRTLLVIVAHPDDETFGIGATLAKYAHEGVAVHCACATRGEVGTVSPELLKGHASIGEMRWDELRCAGEHLGVAGVHWLGFRDSGMEGSPDNRHPDALVNAPVEVVAGRVVQLIRELKPQVIITHDPVGGYRHPDHIHLHKATVMAFRAAGDPAQYLEAGPPHRADKLYYQIFPNRRLRIFVRLMPWFGMDPRRFGRNKDIDLTRVIEVEFPIHARVPVAQYTGIQERAMLCHASQLDGGPPRRGLLGWAFRSRHTHDIFMRAEPPAPDGLREVDLFEGVEDRSTPR